MRSRFHEEAEDDAFAAITYYDEAALGLGDRLLAEIRSAVRYLEQFPLSAPVIEDDIRGKVLVRFPHTLLYAVDAGEIVILAVAHQSQDATSWLAKARDRWGGH